MAASCPWSPPGPRRQPGPWSWRGRAMVAPRRRGIKSDRWRRSVAGGARRAAAPTAAERPALRLLDGARVERRDGARRRAGPAMPRPPRRGARACATATVPRQARQRRRGREPDPVRAAAAARRGVAGRPQQRLGPVVAIRPPATARRTRSRGRRARRATSRQLSGPGDEVDREAGVRRRRGSSRCRPRRRSRR